MKIVKIISREILDSRGNPTIEVDLFFNNGFFGRGSAPSGASRGKSEVVEIRDGSSRYSGLGVTRVIDIIQKKISPDLIGEQFSSQRAFDSFLIELDSSDNKSNIGGNTMLSLSLAFANASSKNRGIPLFMNLIDEFDLDSTVRTPTPMFNVINGGKHSSSRGITFQEFMVVPSLGSIVDQLHDAHIVFNNLKNILLKLSHSVNVGDEGGFAPNLVSNKEALTLLSRAIFESALSSSMQISIDAAASSFYKDNLYYPENSEDGIKSAEMIEYYNNLFEEYHILSLEDPMSESDIDGWVNISNSLGLKKGVDNKRSDSERANSKESDNKRCMIIGDDIFTTNVDLFDRYAVKQGIGDGIIIKPNQIGSITESIDMIKMAKKRGHTIIVSHRSGETEDTSIAHIATAVNSDGKTYFKAGAPCRGERVAKYNELIRINEVLDKAI